MDRREVTGMNYDSQFQCQLQHRSSRPALSVSWHQPESIHSAVLCLICFAFTISKLYQNPLRRELRSSLEQPKLKLSRGWCLRLRSHYMLQRHKYSDQQAHFWTALLGRGYFCMWSTTSHPAGLCQTVRIIHLINSPYWILTMSTALWHYWKSEGISSGDHECLCEISKQPIWYLLRYFSLRQSGGQMLTSTSMNESVNTQKPTLLWNGSSERKCKMKSLHQFIWKQALGVFVLSQASPLHWFEHTRMHAHMHVRSPCINKHDQHLQPIALVHFPYGKYHTRHGNVNSGELPSGKWAYVVLDLISSEDQLLNQDTLFPLAVSLHMTRHSAASTIVTPS